MGFCVCSTFFCALHCVLSSFAIILMGWLLYFVFLVSCDCYCSVAVQIQDFLSVVCVCVCVGGGGGGGSGLMARKHVFFSPQLILQFTEGGPMVLLGRKLYFSKDPEGVQNFQGGGGGSNFFQEGEVSKC